MDDTIKDTRLIEVKDMRLLDLEDDSKTPNAKLGMAPNFAPITVAVTWEQLRFLISCAEQAGAYQLSQRLAAESKSHLDKVTSRSKNWRRYRKD